MPVNAQFLAELERIVGSDGLVRDGGELSTYESDGLVSHRSRPGRRCCRRRPRRCRRW